MSKTVNKIVADVRAISAKTEKQLCQAALKARDNAYCPYSHYQVGAAVLDERGRVFTGCNVENASLGLTVCAERIAIFKGVSEGGS